MVEQSHKTLGKDSELQSHNQRPSERFQEEKTAGTLSV